MSCLATISLTVLVSSGAQAAGGTGPAVPVFEAGVEVVHVTVTIRDREGKLVEGLTAADVEVLEDGRPQRVALFTRVSERGNEENLVLDLGMLFDTSESMAKEMRLAQDSAVRFLGTVPRSRDLLIVFFDRDIRISRYEGEQQQGLFERIWESSGQGRTALYDAIVAYVGRVEGRAGRKVLVVVNDGMDTTNGISEGDMLEVVRASGVTIYPISFANRSFIPGSGDYARANGVLQRLAGITGGEVFEPRSARDLRGIYERILEDLSGQYVAGFVSDRPSADGKWRKLQLRLKVGKGHRVRHRAGYYPALPRAR